MSEITSTSPPRGDATDNAFDRFVDRLGGQVTRDPSEAVQRRFLVGCTTIGLAVAVITVIQSLLVHERLSSLMVGGFGVGLVVLAILLRRGVRLRTVIWGNLGLLAAFLLFESVRSRELHPEQLAWLVLIPLCAAVWSRPTDGAPPAISVRAATLLAAGVAVLIVEAHRTGMTFDEHIETPPWIALADFLPLLLAVGGIVWMLDRTLRRAEAENRRLRGLLPVCSWCRKIRDSRGEWKTVDVYMVERGAEVTHGICTACERDLTGD